jgi:pyruvate-ferredoxin/flavodoxin oxidoreductase
VCPHATIRTKVYEPGELANAPELFKAMDYKSRDLPGMKYTVQVAPEDCTGCALCVEACPAKDKSNPRHKAINMEEQAPHRLAERANWAFFENLPELDRTRSR